MLTCTHCGKKFTARRSDAATCSSSCRAAAYRESKDSRYEVLLRMLQAQARAFREKDAVAQERLAAAADRLIAQAAA